MTTTSEANVRTNKPIFTQEVDGDFYNIHFDPEMIREALAFKPRPGDVIQMSYASSGTRWMQQMIQLIVYEGSSAISSDEVWERCAILEHRAKELDAFTSSPRLIMTHIRPGKLATIPEAKYIYVARNPWDVCCSSHGIAMKLTESAYRVPFDEYVPMFLDGRVSVGPYFEHVNAAYSRRHDPNFFFVTYEEMIADCGGVVLRLADFLGNDFGESLRNNPELLSDVLRKCSAPYMSALHSVSKEKFIRMAFKNPNISREATLRRTEGLEEAVTAVRKAKAGNWRGTFSKAALRMTIDKINSTPQAEFVKELWKDMFNEICHTLE
ncbi:hypothetical protein HPB52_004892 [Rhipicephalus sanguineus]|uniref:Sulfotransferase domain-containing protein n=1 Tax=Rhipicephalus sanguineus TaxID=34632 RepID=A0A9D4SQ72_RHISA|nr:hypothetical protein HPB52_004892 [Rhipicephalus sanguineus]